MFSRKGTVSSAGRAAVLATAATLALTAIGPSAAVAAEFSHGKSVSAVDGNLTDVSARRRGRVNVNGAAAAAAFAGIVGTGIAIAASQNRRGYYDDYDGGPGYYAPRAYYGQPYYGGYGQPYGGGYRGW